MVACGIMICVIVWQVADKGRARAMKYPEVKPTIVDTFLPPVILNLNYGEELVERGL